MYNFLKKIPLFSDLPEDDLERLCQKVEEVHIPAGKDLFPEGSIGDKVYVIKEGQVEILKHSGNREILLAVRQSGEVIGETSLLVSVPRTATVRARTNCVFLAIGQEQFEELLESSPSAARAMFHTVTAHLRATEVLLRQSEKMAQLGTFTAGIAHELNNPASATQRGAQQLRTALSELQESQLKLDSLNMSGEQREYLRSLETTTRQRAAHPSDLDALSRSDREEEVESWLDEHGVENAWNLTSRLVDIDLDTGNLEKLAAHFSDGQFPVVLSWLSAMHSIYSLIEEIDQGSGRISEIVKALKMHTYLDQAPVQSVDVNEGLNNTLVLLRSKLKERSIMVNRELAENLPKILAYGSELNQVWTNLIDNAADALEGSSKGEITVRTRQEGDWIMAEIEDNGPGIPAEIQQKIFDPFFTTKPQGKGTGLGLNITYNIIQKHAGEIKVFSRPGKTTFEVWLPVNFEEVQSGAVPVDTLDRPDDTKLLSILKETKNIAVVGISDRKDRPAFSVPAYLQSQGYHIFPVNPNLDTVLGEKSYPELKDIPEPIDVVLIFRNSEAVPPVVDAAIDIGAKTVWMQEGIVNEPAAKAASEAGLNVVMDTCMRVQHKRLMPQPARE